MNFLDKLKKSSNAKFHENQSSDNRVDPCGQTDRQTDMTKLIVAFRSFVSEPKDNNFNLLYGNVNNNSNDYGNNSTTLKI